ncbi:MAG: hypothetical protein HFE62_03360 [Firmicutes bacterium]|nr:hypothetical protein [Bacillota bacterium]
MKEERMAILSMVEKGVITVEEAERLFNAIGNKNSTDISEKIGEAITKAGEGLSAIAKTVGEKTEKFVEDSKPVVKKAGEKLDKAVDDVRPIAKKAVDSVAEKAENMIKNIKKGDDSNPEGSCECTTDDDFEEDVTIIPVKSESENSGENDSDEKNGSNDEKIED